MRIRFVILALSALLASHVGQAQTQHSVAREWNEVLLQGVRNDFARPTVHARNLFHVSAAMYDAWAVYDGGSSPYFLGHMVDGFIIPFGEVPQPNDVGAAQEEAISYAAYRLIKHRFRRSPGVVETFELCEELMSKLGYDPGLASTDYEQDGPAALGNYIAEQIIAFGLQDGANEAADYANEYYNPINSPLIPTQRGNVYMTYPNRWQPLTFDIFIDQSGNPSFAGTPDFLSPEWGQVSPFALQESDKTTYERDGFTYEVYHDPGAPPYLGLDNPTLAAEYQWGFALVSIWSAHLDPYDGVMWDISPASIGNFDFDDFPTDIEGLRDFYNTLEGGDPSTGHDLNPYTGQSYEPQMVPRGDYTRVLAEFWADGPDSETPPGHWFSILNYVSDQPELVKQYQGQGPVLSDLEWDVKAYFTLGGAVHDAAISAWGIKGWYDYTRPISAIRYMAGRGQCSDPDGDFYSPDGIPIVPGYIEIVTASDPMVGDFLENLGKIKLKAWRGPNFILDPATDEAGVGWILAEDWWPYQRPTFVTPPFAGYVSGHSTFSRAAAEVLTLLTGDPYFPGGMGTFKVEKDSFLVFEKGPSVAFELQWATYRDASEQTSLSRIWGGIHPPVDDIPGRIIGEKVGVSAFQYAQQYITGSVPTGNFTPTAKVFPNPVSTGRPISVWVSQASEALTVSLLDLSGRVIAEKVEAVPQEGKFLQFPSRGLSRGIYLLRLQAEQTQETYKVLVR